MCFIELASDDSEAIEGQLNNCIVSYSDQMIVIIQVFLILLFIFLQRFYASLSDIKAEVETVLREGRQMVEDGLVEDQVTVSAQLDAMKALYNRVRDIHSFIFIIQSSLGQFFFDLILTKRPFFVKTAFLRSKFQYS